MPTHPSLTILALILALLRCTAESHTRDAGSVDAGPHDAGTDPVLHDAGDPLSFDAGVVRPPEPCRVESRQTLIAPDGWDTGARAIALSEDGNDLAVLYGHPAQPILQTFDAQTLESNAPRTTFAEIDGLTLLAPFLDGFVMVGEFARSIAYRYIEDGVVVRDDYFFADDFRAEAIASSRGRLLTLARSDDGLTLSFSLTAFTVTEGTFFEALRPIRTTRTGIHSVTAVAIGDGFGVFWTEPAASNEMSLWFARIDATGRVHGLREVLHRTGWMGAVRATLGEGRFMVTLAHGGEPGIAHISTIAVEADGTPAEDRVLVAETSDHNPDVSYVVGGGFLVTHSPFTVAEPIGGDSQVSLQALDRAGLPTSEAITISDATYRSETGFVSAWSANTVATGEARAVVVWIQTEEPAVPGGDSNIATRAAVVVCAPE